MKIYDSFLFFNELDLLEIRLEMLYDHVDYFILSECDTTFSGISKPFYFEENKERYSKYLDKIIHVKHENSGEIDNIINTHSGERKNIFENILKFYNEIKNTPLTGNAMPHWCRDFLHREFVKIGMSVCDDEDLIIFSDLDEIPDTTKLKLDGESYLIHMKNLIYYINVENTTDKWWGSIVTKYKNLKDKPLNKVRNEMKGYNIMGNTNDLSFSVIENGGWHLTFMGGTSRIQEKIKSYGHQEYNHPYYLTQVEDKLKSNQDILNRDVSIIDIDINQFYPENMLNLIKEKYNYLIK
jgi:beta-1,4-mannosyl-glycoprotein beta-1,4-N-acetylglucosaminyltransferase